MQTATYKDAADKAMNKNSKLSDIKDAAYDAAEDARDDVRDIAYNAGRKVRNFFTSARDEISDTTENVTRAVRNKPVQSSLIALGAGVILGALLSRR